MPIPALTRVLLIGMAVLALSACGRRGPLQPPPGVPEDQAVPLLNENTSGFYDEHNSSAEQRAQQDPLSQSAQQPTTATSTTRLKRSFPLDPVL